MFEFDNYQKSVLELKQGCHTVFASAGSGKTEVLTKRLEQVLDGGIPTKKILCLTFTNRAAESMKNRARNVLGSKANNIFIGNIHALSFKLMSKHGHLLPYFSLATEDVVKKIWNQTINNLICKEKGLANKLERKLSHSETVIKITHFWDNEYNLINKEYNPELFDNVDHTNISMKKSLPRVDFNTLTDEEYVYTKLGISEVSVKNLINDIFSILSKINENSELIFYIQNAIRNIISIKNNQILNNKVSEEYINTVANMLLSRYHSNIQKASLESFIFLSFAFMKEFSELKKELKVFDFDENILGILNFESFKYQWIQIDEVQDFSPLHWLILNHHSADDAHIVHFGDLNQSIYSFMGANIGVTKRFSSKSVFELPNNYRSPKKLVDLYSQYMKNNFLEEDRFSVISKVEDYPDALIRIHASYDGELYKYISDHCCQLTKKFSSIALLCHSNFAVNHLSSKLKEKKIPHFRVSQIDILQTKAGLDFSAYIRSLSKDTDLSAWSRMLWNLAVITTNDDENINGFQPQLYSYYVAAQLLENKVYLSDFANSENIFDHQIKQVSELKKSGYVYFDIETTGLDFYHDKIIQIAAVKVFPNGTQEEIELYCTLNGSVGESFNIHHISDKKLKSFKPLEEHLDKFIEFIEGYPLVSHNLDFDNRMLLNSINDSQKNIYLSCKKYCSLKMSKRLFPDLVSHKLSSLIESFELDYVNTHNALDDAKVGVSLLNFLIVQSENLRHSADEIIDKYSSLLSTFQRNLQLLIDVESQKLPLNNITINDYITIFYHYIQLHRRTIQSSDPDRYKDAIEELNFKLTNWFEQLKNKPNSLDLRDFLASKLVNFKETDLITKNDKLVVSTVHRSKGLEFDSVILPDVTSNAYPNFFIKNMPENIEKQVLMNEQKRLLYVAMTRAKKQLIVGTYDKRDSGWNANISEFIYPVIHEFQMNSIVK